MGIEIKGMIALEDGSQAGGDPLREDDRYPAVDADRLDMRDRPQSRQKIVKGVILITVVLIDVIVGSGGIALLALLGWWLATPMIAGTPTALNSTV